MALQIDLENSGLQEVAKAMREDADVGVQKRKRDDAGDDVRRMNKRVSPNNSNVEATGAASNQQAEALQEYPGLHHDNQNGSAHNANNASSTAAAALAGIYPTMTIPQPTDVTFNAQGSEGERNADSFMGGSQQGDSSFMDTPSQSHTTGGRSGSRPVVGSDEWHKVRKDNHKEGMSLLGVRV